MKRRKFIAFLGGMAIATSRSAIAQTLAKVYRLALVSPAGPVAESSPNAKLLLAGLAEHGYVLGQNLVFEGPHQTTGMPVRLPQLMRDLKANNVDLIVTWGYPTVLAAKEANIPTVAAFGAGDPVATRLVPGIRAE